MYADNECKTFEDLLGVQVVMCWSIAIAYLCNLNLKKEEKIVKYLKIELIMKYLSNYHAYSNRLPLK